MNFKLILTLFLSTLSSLSFANIIERHLEFCNSPSVQKLMNQGDECQIVITSETETATNGICSGLVNKKLPCYVRFVSTPKFSALRLVCGNVKTPVFDRQIVANITSYRVLARITKPDNSEFIVSDTYKYKDLDSELVLLNIGQSEDNSKITSSEISLLIDGSGKPTALTNVSCKFE